MFSRPDDDQTLEAHREREPGIHAKVTSTGAKKRKEFVSCDGNAAINSRRFAALNARADELMRSKIARQRLRIDVCLDNTDPDTRMRVETHWEASARGYSFCLHCHRTFIVFLTIYGQSRMGKPLFSKKRQVSKTAALASTAICTGDRLQIAKHTGALRIAGNVKAMCGFFLRHSSILLYDDVDFHHE